MEIIAKNLNNLIFICSFIILFIVLYFLTKRFFLIFLKKTLTDNELIDNILSKNNIFLYLFYLIPVPILYFTSFLFINIQIVIQKIVLTYTYILVILLLQEILEIIYQIYNSYEISKEKPIKVFIQMGKIIVAVVGSIAIISVIFNTSFITLISGLGALTAILMLVFKDSLLSFKAGIQLIVNDMLRINDWVEIPKYGADGDVIEISLDTIKVRNWDKNNNFYTYL
ncbi:MAG: hypothetical protein KatS3mg068_1784 [Candidatus Sericytochromatia bacterium]|nr:MAG: hypothetical protein KatS3mg068_1784 [Candidatus Sericytochromatia bacterium]